jgi:isoquinoline 1-oxidoreductase
MIEFERYEMKEGPAYRFTPDRRDFLKSLGCGLTLLMVLDAQESGRGGRDPRAMPPEVSAWLHIGEDSQIQVFAGKAEVGQNIRTSLAQAVAEELHCPPDSIHMVLADTDLTPYDMGTFGSRSTPFTAPQLHKVGAAAREALLDLAAQKWAVERALVTLEHGQVKNAKTGTSLAIGELTRGQKLIKTIDASIALTPAESWTVAGQSLPKVNGRDFVTGAHRYTSDQKLPGMQYGRVLRAPSYGAKLTTLDTSKVAGAKVVRDGEFVGVVAADEFAAGKALAAVHADWKPEPQPSGKDLYAYLKSNAEKPRSGGTQKGSIDDALKAADHKLEATYNVAYIAHIPLEPRAAVAEWTGDRLTVRTGTQVPFGVREELAEAFGIPQDRVRVIVPDTGSGYGGKHSGECALEAARLAKAAGKPVKLIWTREEEFMWAYFRPAGVIEVRSAVSKDGLLTAWEYRNYNSGPSALETPYDVPNQSVQFLPAKSPLRQGSYRGLAATANHFAREAHMDELAHAAQMDPLAFRYKNLSNPRMKAVLAAAAERFGWDRRPKASGIACGFDKGGYVACCAQVSDALKIERVVIAFECGAIVNPKHLENQVEGSVMMALGGAMFEQIRFEEGRLLNGRLSRYRVPRFSDLPAIETVLVDRKDLPSAGAGETSIVGLAPAVANAIFQANGKRLRSLPMFPAEAS